MTSKLSLLRAILLDLSDQCVNLKDENQVLRMFDREVEAIDLLYSIQDLFSHGIRKGTINYACGYHDSDNSFGMFLGPTDLATCLSASPNILEKREASIFNLSTNQPIYLWAIDRWVPVNP